MFTIDQRYHLIEEATKQLWMIQSDLVKWLTYLSQICRLDFDMDYLDFYYVKDIHDVTKIRCWSWHTNITIIDSSVNNYASYTPEDLVNTLEQMFLKLKK